LKQVQNRRIEMPLSPHLKHELLEIHRRTVVHGGSTIHRKSTEGRRHYKRRKRKKKKSSTAIHPNVSPINSLLAVESRYSHQDGEYTKDYVGLSQQYKQEEKYRRLRHHQKDRHHKDPCVEEQEDNEEVSRICLESSLSDDVLAYTYTYHNTG